MVWRSLRTSMRTPAVGPLLSPVVLCPLLVDGVNRTVVTVLAYGTLVGTVAVAAWAVLPAGDVDVLREKPDHDARFLRVVTIVYLGTFAVLGGSALPDLLGATDGVTVDGTPIGSPVYALACAVFVVAVVVRATGPTATPDLEPRPATGAHPGTNG